MYLLRSRVASTDVYGCTNTTNEIVIEIKCICAYKPDDDTTARGTKSCHISTILTDMHTYTCMYLLEWSPVTTTACTL